MPTIPTLTGVRPSNWTDAYGGNTVVSSPGASAEAAQAFNIGNLANLYGMAGNVNQFNMAQAGLMREQALPGYGAAQAQSMRNIQQGLQGVVSGDVINQLLQQAAQRGIRTGQGAPGPNTNAAYLAAFARTSLGEQQRAEENLTGAVARAPTAPLFDINPYLIKPEDWQAAQQAANLYASAADPAAAARAAEEAALRAARAGGNLVGGAPSIGGLNRGASSYTPSTWFGSGGGPNEVLAPSTGTGVTRGGVVEYGNPNTAATNWNDWYSNLNRSGWVTSQSTGNWSGIDPRNYMYATPEGTGGGGYDYGSMYEDAGLPYVDYSGGDWAGYDWSQYE